MRASSRALKAQMSERRNRLSDRGKERRPEPVPFEATPPERRKPAYDLPGATGSFADSLEEEEEEMGRNEGWQMILERGIEALRLEMEEKIKMIQVKNRWGHAEMRVCPDACMFPISRKKPPKSSESSKKRRLSILKVKGRGTSGESI